MEQKDRNHTNMEQIDESHVNTEQIDRNQTQVRKRIQELVTAAMLMAVGIILPFFTGQIPQIGSMMLPMHLPVLVCGLICGWQYGGIVGFILPLLRYMFFGMPPMPTALAMAFELAAYGIIVGFLYNHSRWNCIISLYRSLILAMLGGRIVWGIVSIGIYSMTGNVFTWKLFMAGAFLNAIPGIIFQLLFIPALMVSLNKTGLVHFHRRKKMPVRAGKEQEVFSEHE